MTSVELAAQLACAANDVAEQLKRKPSESSHSGGRPDRRPRLGSGPDSSDAWTCPKCNNFNYGGRMFCNKRTCNAPMPQFVPEDDGRGSLLSLLFPDGQQQHVPALEAQAMLPSEQVTGLEVLLPDVRASLESLSAQEAQAAYHVRSSGFIELQQMQHHPSSFGSCPLSLSQAQAQMHAQAHAQVQRMQQMQQNQHAQQADALAQHAQQAQGQVAFETSTQVAMYDSQAGLRQIGISRWTCPHCGNKNQMGHLFCDVRNCGHAKPGLRAADVLGGVSIDDQSNPGAPVSQADPGTLGSIGPRGPMGTMATLRETAQADQAAQAAQAAQAQAVAFAHAQAGQVAQAVQAAQAVQVQVAALAQAQAGRPQPSWVSPPSSSASTSASAATESTSALAGYGSFAGLEDLEGLSGFTQTETEMQMQMLGFDTHALASLVGGIIPCANPTLVSSSGQKDAEPPPGSWVCTNCSNINWPKRTTCNAKTCQRPRAEVDGGTPQTLPVGIPPPIPDGAWVCMQCQNVNWPQRTHCNKRSCGAPRMA